MTKLSIIYCKWQFIIELQAGLINFEIIILNMYLENREVIKKGVPQSVKSPSENEFPQNLQASWNLVGNTFSEEQLKQNPMNAACSRYITILANYFVKAFISIYGLSTDGLHHRCSSFELKIASFEIIFVTLDYLTFLLIFLKLPRLPTSTI